jgi:hypothetical protein
VKEEEPQCISAEQEEMREPELPINSSVKFTTWDNTPISLYADLVARAPHISACMESLLYYLNTNYLFFCE